MSRRSQQWAQPRQGAWEVQRPRGRDELSKLKEEKNSRGAGVKWGWDWITERNGARSRKESSAGKDHAFSLRLMRSLGKDCIRVQCTLMVAFERSLTLLCRELTVSGQGETREGLEGI